MMDAALMKNQDKEKHMDLLQAITTRHSVRNYSDRPIEAEALELLRRTVDECNLASGLNIQFMVNEPGAFSGMMARYGKFRNVGNYFALVGKKDAALDEMCGYYGEKIVLEAARLGLHTCWVGLTYSKGKVPAAVKAGETLRLVVATGYGTTSGVSHKSKPIDALCRVNGAMPDWFRRGMEAARLAPTAMNQQKFRFELDGNAVSASPGRGFYSKVDLGIAKYHFEAGAGTTGWRWA
jgi:nitroreductase